MRPERAFINSLGNSVVMPDIYHELCLLVEQNAGLDDFAALIKYDDLLSHRVIRVANNPIFGFGREVTELRQALFIIGLVQLQDVLLCTLIMRAFHPIPSQIFNFKAFWMHSIACGVLAVKIAKLMQLPARSRFFALGLSLQIGHAAMYAKAPDLALQALMKSNEGMHPLVDLEREYFGFDYCQLGAALMHFWEFPDIYTQIVRHQLDLDKIDKNLQLYADIIHAAYQIQETPGHLCKQLHDLAERHHFTLHIPEDIEKTLCNELDQQSNAIYDILKPPMNYGADMILAR